jgi:Lar family restriction alleviation protein
VTMELKPCPFCGSEKISKVWDPNSRVQAMYACRNCWAKTGPFRDEAKGIESWNRRAPQESPAPAPRGEGAKEIEEALDALREVRHTSRVQFPLWVVDALDKGILALCKASTPTLPAAAGGGEVRECWVEWLGDRPINVFRNLPNDSQRNPGWNLIRMVEAPVVDEDGREECPHGTPMRYALNCMKCIIGEGGRT